MGELMLLLGILVALLVIVLKLMAVNREFTRHAQQVDAVITSYETIKDESSTLYQAHFKFELDGKVFAGQSKRRSAVKPYAIGTTLPILVNRQNPSETRMLGTIAESPLRFALRILQIVLVFFLLFVVVYLLNRW